MTAFLGGWGKTVTSVSIKEEEIIQRVWWSLCYCLQEGTIIPTYHTQCNTAYLFSLISREQQLSGFVSEYWTLWGKSSSCTHVAQCLKKISGSHVICVNNIGILGLVLGIRTTFWHVSWKRTMFQICVSLVCLHCPFQPLLSPFYICINSLHYVLSNKGPGDRVQMLVSTWLLWKILPKWCKSLWQHPLSARWSMCGGWWKEFHLQLSHRIFRNLLWGWKTFIDVIVRIAQPAEWKRHTNWHAKWICTLESYTQSLLSVRQNKMSIEF